MLAELPIRRLLILLAVIPASTCALLALLLLGGASRGLALVAVLAVMFAAVIAAQLLRRAVRSVASTQLQLQTARNELEKLREELDGERRAREQSKAADEKERAPWRGRNIIREMLSGIRERDDELGKFRGNLEQLVEERTLQLQQRTHAMRLVLDHVEQGLATIRRDGTFTSERSRQFDAWFPEPGEGRFFAEQLAPRDAAVQARFQMAWDQVVEGFFPIDAALEQMPKQIDIEGRRYAFEYNPITEEDELEGVLLVITDITAETQRLQRDAEQRELLAVFERFMRDRGGFAQFFQECQALIHSVVSGAVSDTASVMRAIHTVKGNCAAFDVTSVAEVAHRLESAIVDRGELPSNEQLAELQRSFNALSDRVQRLAGEAAASKVEVSSEELNHLLEAATSRVPYAKIVQLLERLKHEPVVNPLRRAAEQAQTLARRLGKGEVKVEIVANDELRLPTERWGGFWAGFVHVVRNAVDHGLERRQERLAAGKEPVGSLRLICKLQDANLCIALSDDGRGINWSRVRERAQEQGLPAETSHDLVEALFTDGVSTAQKITDISGRGVGLSAVRDAARQLGGDVDVSSTLGEGTTFRFLFPLEKFSEPLRESARACA